MSAYGDYPPGAVRMGAARGEVDRRYVDFVEPGNYRARVDWPARDELVWRAAKGVGG